MAASFIYLRWLDFYEAEQEAIAVLDDAHYSRIMPPAFRWRQICTLSNSDLKVRIRALVGNLRTVGHGSSSPVGVMLQRIAPSLNRLAEYDSIAVSEMMAWVALQPFETQTDRLRLLGTLDQILLRCAGKEAGTFLTPQIVVDLMVALAAPQQGESLYDPCFGSANLLTTAMTYAEAHPSNDLQTGRSQLKVSGGEVNENAFLTGLVRLMLAGVEDPCIELGNSLDREAIGDSVMNGFDVVLSNPPWGMSIDLHGLPHYAIETKESSSLFVQHILQQLRPGGRAVIAVPPGFLFRRGVDQEMRRWLLENHSVDAVISLPPSTFQPYTAINSYLLVVRRGGKTQSVRMVEAVSDFAKMQKFTSSSNQSEMIQQICKRVKSLTAEENAWDVAFESLESIGFDLTPKRRNQSGLDRILGEFPEGTSLERLGDLCRISLGRAIKTNDLLNTQSNSTFNASGHTLFREIEEEAIHKQKVPAFADEAIPYIRISDIQKHQYTRSSMWLAPETAANLDPKYRLKSGDLLVSRSGTIGKSAIVTNNAVGGVASGSLFVVQRREDSIDPNFLLAYLQSNEVIAWMQDRSRGTTILNLAVDHFRDLPVPILPLQVQQRAVDLWRETGDDILRLTQSILSGKEFSSFEKWLEAALMATADVNQLAERGRSLWTDMGIELRSLIDASKRTKLENDRIVHWGIHFSTCLEFIGIGKPRGRDRSQFERLLFAESQSNLSLNALRVADSVFRNKAELVTERVQQWISSEGIRIVKHTKLRLTTDCQKVAIGRQTTITFVATQDGDVPLLNIEIDSDPKSSTQHLQYLERQSDEPIEFTFTLTEPTDIFRLKLYWSANTVIGIQVSGEIEFAFSVDSDSASNSSLPSSIGASPYVCGDPVKPNRDDVFFGREELLDQIQRQVMVSGNVVLLEGNRRAGKSSILWHLEGPNSIQGWLGVYCSLQGMEGDPRGGVRTSDFFRGIAHDLAQSIRKLFGSVMLPDGTILDATRKLGIGRAMREGISDDSPFQDFREYLAYILETLEGRQLKLLLMLDEFDKLQEGIDTGVTSPQVPENIRFLVQSNSRLSAILTGSRRLRRMREEYWSALFGLGTRFGVTALPADAATRLITEPVRSQLTFAKSASDLCYSLTAGQPYLLQCLCNRIFEQAATSSQRSITVDQVESAALSTIEDNEHFASLWDYCEFDRRRLLLYLLHRESEGNDILRLEVIQTRFEQLGVFVDEEVLAEDLEFLRELELVTTHGSRSGMHYGLAISLMGMWMETQHDFTLLTSRAFHECGSTGADSDAQFDESQKPTDLIQDRESEDD